MTREKVRAAGCRLLDWHKRFVGFFGRREAREHSETYLRGLLSDVRRKNVEAIALRFAKPKDGAGLDFAPETD